MAMINTPYGKRELVRRAGVAGEYYYTEPTSAAPHGEWWVLNEQRGYVPVASNAPGLLGAIKAEAVASAQRGPLYVSFGPCDRLNPGFGYQIKIERACSGMLVLCTDKHPLTGADLDFAGCLEVAAMYTPTAK
jgi:hypothetical protein